jgi:GTP-binding protein
MLTITIVGRPNVGKSTLFNRLVGARQAIVDDQPGVTRDRLFGRFEWRGRRGKVIDTGGYLTGQDDKLGRRIVENAEAGIGEADVVVVLVDGREGITAADRDLVDYIRLHPKPVILAVNKIEHPNHEPLVYPFYELGLEPVIGISALQGTRVGDLLDKVYELAPEDWGADEEEEQIRVTILGRPNVGKSTLLNKLAGSNRSLVDAAPGTTRDPVDTLLVHGGRRYRFVDTAGIRAAGKIGSDVERYGILRARKTIERSDVALLLIDANEGPTESDLRVFRLADEAGLASVLLVNKWDMIEKETGTAEAFERTVREKFVFLQYAPLLFISALSGQRTHRIFELIEKGFETARRKIPSSQLNKLLDEIKLRTPPPLGKWGKAVNLYYWSQTGIAPPVITLFANRPADLPDNYRRFLLNQLYEHFDLTGSPLRLIIRKSPKREKK